MKANSDVSQPQQELKVAEPKYASLEDKKWVLKTLKLKCHTDALNAAGHIGLWLLCLIAIELPAKVGKANKVYREDGSLTDQAKKAAVQTMSEEVASRQFGIRVRRLCQRHVLNCIREAFNLGPPLI